MAVPLPTRFPIFPLPGTVLFPSVKLPLHVFEPRYRAMIQAALAGDGVVGIVLLRPEVDAMQPQAPTFSVGCAGRIVEHSRLPDGRFVVVLQGERRFRIEREEQSKDGDAAYRIAQAALLPDPAFSEFDPPLQAELGAARDRLEERMLGLLAARAGNALEALREHLATLDAIELLHGIAFGLDRDPLEKQSLLETDDPAERYVRLNELLTFAEAESRLSETSKILN